MPVRKLTMADLNRLSVPEAAAGPKLPYVLVLDNIRSMLNVGSIFRTADAFACEKLYLTGITGTPPHREIQKTALGSEQTVSWTYSASTAEVLKVLRDEGYLCLAVEQTVGSIKLDAWEPDTTQPLALVLGNEVEGVSDEALALCNGALEIPQYGHKHSLNVAVAAGVVMWQAMNAFIKR